eukprot:9994619-Ditylum_brightwellii.AAC.3
MDAWKHCLHHSTGEHRLGAVKTWGQTPASKISRFIVTKPKSSWLLPPGSGPENLARATKSATDQLTALYGPRKAGRSSQQQLDLLLHRLLQCYRNEDPPPEPQLAVPIKVVEHIAQSYAPSNMTKTIQDLVQLQFLFLLRVGQYTLPAGSRQILTIQFRQKDVCFSKNGHVLDHTRDTAVLTDADAVTLILTNQKNSKKNAILHYHMSGTDI